MKISKADNRYLKEGLLQINLSERTNSRELLNQRKKLARSLRPCALRRPMSATPYRVSFNKFVKSNVSKIKIFVLHHL